MTHAGDRILNGILEAVERAYRAPQGRTEEQLQAFLKPKLKALQPKPGESANAYRARLLSVFSGRRWKALRRKIAADYTDVSAEVTGLVNESLEQAFAEGLNEAAYALARGGADMWPITEKIVAELVLNGVLTLNRHKLKKRKDTQYNEQRAQSAVSGAVARDVKVEDMAKDVSRHIARARQRDTIAYARATIYGASDYGGYMAGREAEEAGIEVQKTWLAIPDLRVRPSHGNLHGVTLPMDEKFRGLHGSLSYPHDPDAPPEETYNCRCRMAIHMAGKAPKPNVQYVSMTETGKYRKWRDQQIQKAGGEVELAKIHSELMRG